MLAIVLWPPLRALVLIVYFGSNKFLFLKQIPESGNDSIHEQLQLQKFIFNAVVIQ